MNETVLGKLEKVDLRDAWPDEANNFTTWLAEEENIALLGEAVGMELEVETTEKGVGPFSADILCKDTVRDAWVVVENQLERTDHTHLGQTLTYAAGLGAMSVIWIAAEIRDEHRAAIDWLNQISDEDHQFFALEIELWRIGGSQMAPKFNVAAAPNDWSKSLAKIKISAESNLYQRYWAALVATHGEDSEVIRSGRKSQSSWKSFPLGRTNFCLSAWLNKRNQALRAAVEIGGDDAEVFLRILETRKEEIEEEIGENLVWDSNPARKTKYIYIDRPKSKLEDQAQWSEQHAWLRDKLEHLYRAFAPRIKELDASDDTPEDDSPHFKDPEALPDEQS